MNSTQLERKRAGICTLCGIVRTNRRHLNCLKCRKDLKKRYEARKPQWINLREVRVWIRHCSVLQILRTNKDLCKVCGKQMIEEKKKEKKVGLQRVSATSGKK